MPPALPMGEITGGTTRGTRASTEDAAKLRTTEMTQTTGARQRTLLTGAAALLALGACANSGYDLDLRGNFGDAFHTKTAVQNVPTEPRPRPDNRGLISYPGYQVAVARTGDTVGDVAGRVGLSADELATYNGIPRGQKLRRGEIIALPRRVSEPSPATGSAVTGPITPITSPAIRTPETVSVVPLDSVSSSATSANAANTAAPSGQEPARHKVKRGETAYSIARLFGVPVKSLAEWNGLTGELAIREGQYLLIPVAVPGAVPVIDAATKPGSGTVAPVPPSAASPLPDKNETADKPKETPPSPNLAGTQTSASDTGRFALPASGPIIRTFSKGKNDGIDISAAAGSPVRAAQTGTVAAITRDTDRVPIIVLRHSGNILTVYAGVEGVTVEKGETVKRGQAIAKIRASASPGLHFEVREGFDSVDPEPYLK